MNSRLSGLVPATLASSLYHLPFHLYAGRSQGQLGYALPLAFTNGVFGGLVCRAVKEFLDTLP